MATSPERSFLDRKVSRRTFNHAAIVGAAAGAVAALSPALASATETGYDGQRIQIVNTFVLENTTVNTDNYWKFGVQHKEVMQKEEQLDKFLGAMEPEKRPDEESIRRFKDALKNGQLIAIQVWNPKLGAEKQSLIRGDVVKKDDGVLHASLLKIPESSLRDLTPEVKEKMGICQAERAIFLIHTQDTNSADTADVTIREEANLSTY